MGKKTKKDDKDPSGSGFDPLLVESRQAPTVVLMLNSTEEDILIKACDAIYKFAVKYDDNKQLLISLEALPRLVLLQKHVNPLVRCNASMAVAALSQCLDGLKHLRNDEEAVTTLIQLLSPEESQSVHEYACLGLSSLAASYTGRKVIIEHNGLPALVSRLSSPDADVQKNAIDTIAYLLEDPQVRITIREVHGIGPIVDLLNSEFPVIQHQILNALRLISEEKTNHSSLMEFGALSTLIDFIGDPQLNDLHVASTQVLANCMENADILRMMNDAQLLKRFTAFITDQSPPKIQQEDKKAKKKKAPGSGRKSRTAKGKQVVEKQILITPTLPEVKVEAGSLFEKAARNEECRRLLHEQEAEDTIIRLLKSNHGDVQVSAARALRAMAADLTSREVFGQSGAIPLLIDMCRSDELETRSVAVVALHVMTEDNRKNSDRIIQSNGIDPLLDLIDNDDDDDPLCIINSSLTLVNILLEQLPSGEGLEDKVMSRSTKQLSHSNDEVTIIVTRLIAVCARDKKARQTFIGLDGLIPLTKLLQSANRDVRRTVTCAMTTLTDSESTAVKLMQLGALNILLETQSHESTRNVYSESLLNKLLDCNLSAKFALTGYIGQDNHIDDGFFDAGELTDQLQLMTIEEHCKRPLNQLRPVILINASSTSEEVDSSQETAGSTDCLPVDSELTEYIKELMSHLAGLTLLTDKIQIIANFVADKMGGAVERSRLIDFSWELPLNELRYKRKSNVVPIGQIRRGVHCHRALLFKTLADRVDVPCTLVRGQCNRAWNEIELDVVNRQESDERQRSKKFLVNLMDHPGDLMALDSPEAVLYTRIR